MQSKIQVLFHFSFYFNMDDNRMVGMDYHSLHLSGRTMGEPSGQLNSRWKSSELDTGPITLKQEN
jgi:hypothetical protein